MESMQLARTHTHATRTISVSSVTYLLWFCEWWNRYDLRQTRANNDNNNSAASKTGR